MVVIYITVIVTQSGDIEKIIENLEIDNVIQHGNNMLALWQAHVL